MRKRCGHGCASVFRPAGRASAFGPAEPVLTPEELVPPMMFRKQFLWEGQGRLSDHVSLDFEGYQNSNQNCSLCRLFFTFLCIWMIAYMQHHYGNAIRCHPNDLEGMKKPCWAVFYHSLVREQHAPVLSGREAVLVLIPAGCGIQK